jgi:hypothetical protein
VSKRAKRTDKVPWLYLATGCWWCGRSPKDTARTREHLVPKSEGGLSTRENMRVACRGCNQRRGTERGWMSFFRHRGVYHPAMPESQWAHLQRVYGEDATAAD